MHGCRRPGTPKTTYPEPRSANERGAAGAPTALGASLHALSTRSAAAVMPTARHAMQPGRTHRAGDDTKLSTDQDTRTLLHSNDFRRIYATAMPGFVARGASENALKGRFEPRAPLARGARAGTLHGGFLPQTGAPACAAPCPGRH